MKIKIFIISLLLTLLIVGVTLGETYVPISLYPIGIFLIVLCIVFYVYKLLFNEKKHFEDLCQCLNNSINSVKIEILQNQSVCKDQILSNIADRFLSMNQTITQNIDSLKEELSQKTNTILDNLSAQAEIIDDKFNKEKELLESLLEKTQSLSAEIITEISRSSKMLECILNNIIENLKNEEERTRKHIEETCNNVSSQLNSQSRIIGESINTSSNLFTKISQENKEILITSISELSSQELSFRETLSLSLSDILQKNNILQELVRVSQESLMNNINNRGNEVTEYISKCIVDAIGNVLDSLNKTQIYLEKSTETLLRNSKQQGDNVNNNILVTIERNDALKDILISSVTQLVDILTTTKLQTADIIRNVEAVQLQNSNLQESIINNNKLIENNTDSVVASTGRHKTEIVELVSQNSESMSKCIEQHVSNALYTLTDNINQAKALTIKTENSVLQSKNEQVQVVDNVIQELEKQSSVIQHKLDNTQNKVLAQTEQMNMTFKTTIDEMNNCFISEGLKSSESIKSNISDAVNKIKESVGETLKLNSNNAEQLSESLASMSNTISNKISTVEGQTQIITKGIKTLNDLYKDNSNSLKSVNSQFDLLHKGITSAQIQSNNVERLISQLAKESSNSAIIDSIKLMIADLRKEVLVGVSNLHNGILESQVEQKVINDELIKLQAILRNIPTDSVYQVDGTQKSSSKNPNKATTNLSTPEGESKKYLDVDQICPIVPSVNPSIGKKIDLKPNRTETIVDNETNNIVYNQFVNGELSKSTMKDKKGRLIYELEYKNGKIFRSRNYDAKGIMNIEQTYYDNGQVHYRNEKTIKGKISTEFDKYGNKK